ncbi:MAG: GTP-binding protein [Eubacteriaceae bacterium]|nr:GTP-binding protein [Eubacteriaceae bacterium]
MEQGNHKPSNGHDHAQSSHRRPVIVIGGFLGAGKTTTLNHYLSTGDDNRTNVIIREYGEASIDDQLLGIDKSRIHVFPGMSVHQDPQLLLYDYMHDMFEHDRRNFDRVVIETSGLDSPESIVQLFMVGAMQNIYRFNGYIVIVDAEYGILNLEEFAVSVEQIAFADAIVINKADRSDEAKIAELVGHLRSINAIAPIYTTEFGRIDLLGTAGFDVFKQLSGKAPLESISQSKYAASTVILSESRPIDKAKAIDWVNSIYGNYGWNIMRGRGFFSFSQDSYIYEFDSIRKSFHSSAMKQWDAYKDAHERESIVAFIGSGLPGREQMQREFSSLAE